MNFSLYYPESKRKACGVRDFNNHLRKALISEGHMETPGEGFGVIEYSPYLYPSLWSILKIFFSHKGKVSVFFHELYYPFSFSLRGIVIGLPHLFRFFILVHLSHRCFFSSAIFYDIWVKRLPYLKQKMLWLFVGSNIDVVPNDTTPQTDTITLLHFGGAHPTHLYEHVFAAFELVSSKLNKKNVQLLLIGVDKNQLHHKSKDLKQVFYFPFLGEREVSLKISAATLVLAPFLDGISTRRSSVMAALAHGKPVLTTTKKDANSSFTTWSEFTVTVDADIENSVNLYAQKALEILSLDPSQLRQIGDHAKAYYHNHFNWDLLAKKIVQNLIY